MENHAGEGGPFEQTITVSGKPEIKVTKAEPVTPMQPTLSADPYMLAARFALWLSGLVAVVTMAAALYTYVPSMRAERISMQPPPYNTAQSRWSPSTIEAEGEPVLFANPFDESEVFEFPQGTHDAEARAVVAEMLMERARERYARLDAKSHKRR